MTQEKKETAIRRLHLVLKRKFKGQAIQMTWAQMEGLLAAAQTIERMWLRLRRSKRRMQ